MNKLITLFVLMVSTVGYGQNFTLKKMSDLDKTAEITQENYLIIQAQGKMINDEPCSNMIYLRGNLESVTPDSIYVRAQEVTINSSINDKHRQNITYWEYDIPIQGLAIDDLIGITQYPSAHIKNRRANLVGVSGLFIGAGIVTGVSGLFVRDKHDRQKLLWAGLAQISVGTTFAILSGRKKEYGFKYSDDPWTFD